MRKTICLAVSCAFAGFLSITSNASADDFAPPPWRGGPNYTLQGWEFLQPAPTIGGFYQVADDPTVPQHWGNGPVPFFVPVPPFGLSTPDPLITWPDTMAWTPGPDGDGHVIGPGAMTIWCPNWIDNEQIKQFRIQVTFDGTPPLPLGPLLGGFGTDPNNTVPGVPVSGPIFVDNRHWFQDWIIQPNPDWERFGLEFPTGSSIDEIVIDTISYTIPEPTTLSLLVVGITAMTARRRR